MSRSTARRLVTPAVGLVVTSCQHMQDLASESTPGGPGAERVCRIEGVREKWPGIRSGDDGNRRGKAIKRFFAP